ncbi:Protein of unknown function [Bacillus mycoides]|nr:Protein of unknown function [Bacillus mycoides]
MDGKILIKPYEHY